MKRSFTFKFEEKPNDSISYNTTKKDKIDIDIKDEVPAILLTKSACLVLAKILIQMGSNNYSINFHFHMEKDFDTDKKELFRFHLINMGK
jgi:hypothetical protein